MPRPSKYNDPRGRIVDAARTLIVAQGFDKVSLRAIARASGFSPASLYEYFGGKAELMGAVAREANQALASSLKTALKNEDPTQPDALVVLGMAYIDFARREPERFLLLFSHHRSSRRSLEEPAPAESAFSVVTEVVRACLDAGTLQGTEGSEETLGYALWSAAHGTAMLQLTALQGFGADFPSTDRVLLEALVAGFRSKP